MTDGVVKIEVLEIDGNDFEEVKLKLPGGIPKGVGEDATIKLVDKSAGRAVVGAGTDKMDVTFK